ncbi:hypothetical protein Q5752_004460 [Cryptotrichosporon argae]
MSTPTPTAASVSSLAAPLAPAVGVDEKTPLVPVVEVAREPRRARRVVELLFGLSMLFFFGLLGVRHLVFPLYDHNLKLALLFLHVLNTILAHFVLVANCASRAELALYLVAVDGVSAPVLFWTARGLSASLGWGL